MIQKARVNWIKAGDDSSTYFYASLKDRNARKHIDVFFNESDEPLENENAIIEEARIYYVGWMGSATVKSRGIHIYVVRKGPQLSMDKATALICPIKMRKLKRLYALLTIKRLHV